jgi:hypothetical protein
VRFLLLCIFFIWVTHTTAFFSHEYAHSTTAWLLGYKSNPLALDYGRFTLGNVLLLGQVDENVDYRAIFSQNHGHAAAFIAFAGSGIGNAPLYLVTLLLLWKEAVRRQPRLFLFLFWLNLMCVCNFYDYVPIRTFASHGDIANITHGLKVSPWAVVAVAGYPIAFAMWYFFARTLKDASSLLVPGSRGLQVTLLVICAFLMFGYFGASGMFGYGDVSQTLSGLSFLAIPGIVLACWPSRASSVASD